MVDSTLLSIPMEAAKANENIITVTTEAGGHMGWLEKYEGVPKTGPTEGGAGDGASPVESQW